MNPRITDQTEDADIYKFRLSGVNLSLANALRRIILNDIDTVVFRTETYNDNQCIISVNTSRLHNEILKQRLSCIPIHSTDLKELPGNYIMECDVTNNTEHIMIVTTEDFRIKNKTTGNYLTEKETRKIFPADKLSGRFIDFARLRPKIGDILGEQLKLSCEFSVASVAVNSMFNVVSKCAYMFTRDTAKVEQIWSEKQAEMQTTSASKQDIEFAKSNFMMLDAERYFVEDSFDFVMRSVGVFDCQTIVKKACAVMQRKLMTTAEAVESDVVPILPTETSSMKTTMENCYDIVLENEDYTLGKALEYYLYATYYEGAKTLTFCGFKKLHPHDSSSRIRLAFKEKADKALVRSYIREACLKLNDVYEKIRGY
jgi:DNA-directed RNA polymerase subunit L